MSPERNPPNTVGPGLEEAGVFREEAVSPGLMFLSVCHQGGRRMGRSETGEAGRESHRGRE